MNVKFLAIYTDKKALISVFFLVLFFFKVLVSAIYVAEMFGCPLDQRLGASDCIATISAWN